MVCARDAFCDLSCIPFHYLNIPDLVQLHVLLQVVDRSRVLIYSDHMRGWISFSNKDAERARASEHIHNSFTHFYLIRDPRPFSGETGGEIYLCQVAQVS